MNVRHQNKNLYFKDRTITYCNFHCLHPFSFLFSFYFVAWTLSSFLLFILFFFFFVFTVFLSSAARSISYKLYASSPHFIFHVNKTREDKIMLLLLVLPFVILFIMCSAWILHTTCPLRIFPTTCSFFSIACSFPCPFHEFYFFR